MGDIRHLIVSSVLVFLLGAFAKAQADRAAAPLPRSDDRKLGDYLRQASDEFAVPLDLVKALAYVGSHFRERDDMEGPSDVPRAYGIMGLHDDDWFGRSLERGAALAGTTAALAKHDSAANIRSAAALLASFAAEQRLQSGVSAENLESWKAIIERFSGIHNQDAAAGFAARVFRLLHDGVSQREVTIAPHPEIPEEAVLPPSSWRSRGQPAGLWGYPEAIWVGPPPASNYQPGRGENTITLAILHTTESTAEAALDWFLNPASGVSAHYVVGADGTIWQVVDDRDTAYHAGNFAYNQSAIGIEMEGYAGGFGADFSWQTPEQHDSVVALVAWLTSQYLIEIDRGHIIGHNQVPGVNLPGCGGPDSWGGCSNHYDPGAWWNWTALMSDIGRPPTAGSLTVVSDCAAIVLPFEQAPAVTNLWNGQRFATYDFADGYYLLYIDGHELPQPHLPAGGQFHWDAWLPDWCANLDDGPYLEVANIFPSWLPLFDSVGDNSPVIAHSIDGKRLAPTGNSVYDSDGRLWYEFFLAWDTAAQTGWAPIDAFGFDSKLK